MRVCRGFLLTLLASLFLPVAATAQVIIGPGVGGAPEVQLIEPAGTRYIFGLLPVVSSAA